MHHDDGMTREEMAKLAQDTATSIELPEPGCRAVVIVTDAAGDFVGVGSTTGTYDTALIVWCAAHGADRIDHVRGGTAETWRLGKRAEPHEYHCSQEERERDRKG